MTNEELKRISDYCEDNDESLCSLALHAINCKRAGITEDALKGAAIEYRAHHEFFGTVRYSDPETAALIGAYPVLVIPVQEKSE